tara:strand:- start:386 stop:979 length:594 start_codon:yes stop_codon:yes gene_type:complete
MNGIAVPMQETDRTLIRQHLAGDREAFDQLVLKYHRPIYQFLYRMLVVHERAEDLAQETFLRAYRAAGSYNPRYRFSTWLYTIAKNLARNEMQRRRRESRMTFRGELEDLVEAGRSGDQPGPDEIASLNEEGKRVRQAMEGLGDNLKMALILGHYQGLSYKEISEILRRPRGTIKSWVFRAKRELIKRLRDMESRGL